MKDEIIVKATVAALRATARRKSDLLALVSGTGVIYRFDGTVTTADNGSTVLKPDAVASDARGRWLAVGSTSGATESDPGEKAVNVLRIAADVVDGEEVVIGADTYEFNDTEGDVDEGNIWVDVSGGKTPTAATTALEAAINADATEAVSAVKVSNNEVLVIADQVGVVTLACTTDLTGVNSGWAHTAMYGGSAAAARQSVAVSRVPKAVEVALGNMHFRLPFTPTTAIVQVRVTATGDIKAFTGLVALSAGAVTVTNDGGGDFAATDTVHLLAVA